MWSLWQRREQWNWVKTGHLIKKKKQTSHFSQRSVLSLWQTRCHVLRRDQNWSQGSLFYGAFTAVNWHRIPWRSSGTVKWPFDLIKLAKSKIMTLPWSTPVQIWWMGYKPRFNKCVSDQRFMLVPETKSAVSLSPAQKRPSRFNSHRVMLTFHLVTQSKCVPN